MFSIDFMIWIDMKLDSSFIKQCDQNLASPLLLSICYVSYFTMMHSESNSEANKLKSNKPESHSTYINLHLHSTADSEFDMAWIYDIVRTDWKALGIVWTFSHWRAVYKKFESSDGKAFASTSVCIDKPFATGLYLWLQTVHEIAFKLYKVLNKKRRQNPTLCRPWQVAWCSCYQCNCDAISGVQTSVWGINIYTKFFQLLFEWSIVL